MEVYLRAFITSALDGGEWLTPRPLGGRGRGTRTGLEAVEREKSCHCLELNSPSSSAEVMNVWRYASFKTQCFLSIIYIHFRLQMPVPGARVMTASLPD